MLDAAVLAGFVRAQTFAKLDRKSPAIRNFSNR
jgi:hypothetical protein